MISKVINRARKTVNTIQRKFATKGLILMYHRVAEVGCDPWGLCVSPPNFAEHLQVLKTAANVMRLEELAQAHQQGNIPERAVVITFDDGYIDNFVNAKPLLEKYEIPATIFLVSGYIGKDREFWWDEVERVFLSPGKLPATLTLKINDRVYNWDLSQVTEYTETDYQRDRHLSAWQGKKGSRQAIFYSVWETLQPLPNQQQKLALDHILQWSQKSPNARHDYRPMNSDEVQKLISGGLIEVGAHTVNHPFLSAHGETDQQEEIAQGKTDIEKLLGRTITTFTYPFGAYNRTTVPLVKNLGFTCACSTEALPVWWKCDPYQLPRFGVNNWDGEQFHKQLLKWWEI